MNPYTKALSNYMQRCHVSASPLAALFDMDGTLYDSMPGHVKAWQQMFGDEGIEIEPLDILMAEGRTGTDTVRQIFLDRRGRRISDDDCRRMYSRKAEIFAAMPPVPLMPGAHRLVQAAAKAGLITVLVTGSGQKNLFERLEQDFPGAFPPERRVTALNVTHGKPSPEPFLKGLELAGVQPHQAMAFDNAPLGVLSAARAKVLTIGVVTGPIPAQALTDAGADAIFLSMSECAAAFENILNTQT